MPDATVPRRRRIASAVGPDRRESVSRFYDDFAVAFAGMCSIVHGCLSSIWDCIDLECTCVPRLRLTRPSRFGYNTGPSAPPGLIWRILVPRIPRTLLAVALLFDFANGVEVFVELELIVATQSVDPAQRGW